MFEKYYEKIYAGVLGKIIGVYLGRPVEGWSYEDISNQLGDISNVPRGINNFTWPTVLNS